MQQVWLGTRTRRAARAGMGLGLAAALASACGEDEAVPVLDSATVGELSPAQLESLCDELSDAWENQEYASCLRREVDSYYRVEAVPGECSLSSVACDITAGELRACDRARRADVCGAGGEATAACAPLIQRGCSSSLPVVTPWSDACPDLAAAVAPYEGIYELSRHTLNDTSCDTEGASVLETDARRLFVVVTIIIYGNPIGRMESCDDIEHCRAVADSLRRYSQRTDPEATQPDVTSFERELHCHTTIEGALESERDSAKTIAAEGRCSLEQTLEVITRTPDGTLRREARTRAWEQPIEDDGFCPFSQPDDPAPPTVPCSRFQVYEARLVSTL
jgi:hypothetical protein